MRSPYPYARIGQIDTAAARSLAGVEADVTGEELAAGYRPMPFPLEVGSADGEANSKRPNFALSTGKVRHMGECVAAVIATDAATAADAAEEVLVDWEPLPAVAGVEQALEADATVLFDEMESNSQERWRRKVGDVEEAMIGSTPAIVNAVMDALKPLGIRHLNMPLTPEKVWQAIHTNGTAADRDFSLNEEEVEGWTASMWPLATR